MFEENGSAMINIDELCELLIIGKNTAYNLLKTGQIHAFKIGRIWKIPRNSVSEYIIEQSSTYYHHNHSGQIPDKP